MQSSAGEPKITVITATRNLIESGRRDVFINCISSLHEQDYPNIEHIIIDAASNDGTLEMFDKMGLNYISEPDSGIYDAYNKGISKSTGKYIIFLNSDDFLTRPDGISYCIDCLERNQADFSFGPVLICGFDGTVKKRAAHFLNEMFLSTPFCHSSMIATRKMLTELGGFNLDYKIVSDFDLMWRAFQFGYRPVRLRQVFAAWRLGGESTSNIAKRNAEYYQVIQQRTRLSSEQVAEIKSRGFLSQKLLSELLNSCPHLPFGFRLRAVNFFRMVRHMRRRMLSIYVHNGRLVHAYMLGIKLYKGEKR